MRERELVEPAQSHKTLPWDRAVVQDNTDYNKIKESTTENYVKIWSKVRVVIENLSEKDDN